MKTFHSQESSDQTDPFKKIAYLERKLSRLQESQIHQEKLEDLNRLLLKNALQELETARQKSESANRAKTDFLANMSHEIRTPLNILLGMSELLEGTPLDDKQKQFVTKGREAGQHLLELINNILEFSKIEKGVNTLENHPFNLKHLVNNLATIFETTCQQKGLKFHFKNIADHHSHYMGDEPKIRQILLNLLTNAVKFTDQGSISFSVSVDQNNQDTLIFRIQDSGIGIRKEFQNQIFDRFNQIEPAISKSRQGGVGLGLAIVKLLTEEMSGSIILKSQPGEGSCFTVHLPLEAIDNTIVTVVDDYRTKTHSTELVDIDLLVVDDVPGNLYVVEHFLDGLSLNVTYCQGGKQATELYRRTTFDAILMDICMPDIDGIEAFKNIRRYEKDNGLQPSYVVAMTAHAFQEIKADLCKEGFDNILTKPFSRDELIESLTKRKSLSQQKQSWASPEPFADYRKLDVNIPVLLKPLIPVLIEKLNGGHADIWTAVSNRECERAAKYCHANKGVAGMYGFNKLSRIYAEIESDIREEQYASAELAYKKLTDYLSEVTEKYAS